ncbi:MAG: EthD domain-containing protein [Sphingomonadales bacterium]|nr:EthD domain-containing protein [Sphingomonadales bacterium]
MTYKLVYLARRAATVTREDWPRTWKSHAVFASQFPVLEAKIDWMRYCNRAEVALPDLSQAHDGVAVAAGEMLEGLTGAGFSDEDRALIDQDELRVFDMLTPNFTYYCQEDVLREGPLGEAAVWRFLKRRPDLTRAEFAAQWDEHRPTPPTATRYVRNHPVHEPLPLFPFDGIGECWFASLEDAVASVSAGARTPPFADPDGCVTLVTTVCHRWPKGRS